MEFHLAPSTTELLEEPTATQLFKIIHTLHGSCYIHYKPPTWSQTGDSSPNFRIPYFLRNMFAYY